MTQGVTLNKADSERFTRMLMQFEEDTLVIECNYDDWLAAYPDRWVAVYGGKLLANAKTLAEALQIAYDRGAPHGCVASAYMDTDPQIMIL